MTYRFVPAPGVSQITQISSKNVSGGLLRLGSRIYALDMVRALLSITIDPRTAADQQRLADGLRALMAEDPTIGPLVDADGARTTIHSLGEQQLEIIVERLHREFHVNAALGTPQVICRITVMREAFGESRYSRQVDGRGHYAHVALRVIPQPAEGGYFFYNLLEGDTLPARFVLAVRAAVRQSFPSEPRVDLKVELAGGSYHEVDSSDEDFRIAATLACQQALVKSGPALLEPIMRVQIRTPPEYLDDIASNLAKSRRARIESQIYSGGSFLLVAEAAMRQMLGFAHDLRSRTMGRASFSLQFSHYAPVRSDADDGGLGVRQAISSPPPLRSSGAEVLEP